MTDTKKEGNLKEFHFGGHESFHFRTGWLKKAWATANSKMDFSTPDITETLGVGRNMVLSIRHWGIAAGIIESNKDGKGCIGTEIGELLFEEYDTYLEDPASYWLLHYNLATNFNKAPFWAWAFNNLSLREFNRENALNSIKFFLQKQNLRKLPSDTTLENDFQTFIRTYCSRESEKGNGEDILDSPFEELGIIINNTDNTYRFSIGEKKSLPAEIVAYAIWRMPETQNSSAKGTAPAINLETLLIGTNSPGMCFKLDGETLVRYLEEICSRKLLGKAEYSTAAGIRQLLLSDRFPTKAQAILDPYYKKAGK